MAYNRILKDQIIDSAANVQYTYSAHWIIVNGLKKKLKAFKIAQIIMTSISTGGFLATVISGIPQLSWIGGLPSAVALGINLYMLSFNLPECIKEHTDAANELWEVKEIYKSLIVDFDDIDNDEIINRRDSLISMVSKINKKYPGTDEKSFKRAQGDIGKYKFSDGEAAKVINMRE